MSLVQVLNHKLTLDAGEYHQWYWWKQWV